MTETGKHIETVRILSNPEYLTQALARAGEAPEVVLESDLRLVLGRGTRRPS